MRRFFVDELNEQENTVTLSGKEFRHLKNVLRLNKGDKVALFDGKGKELSGFISSSGNKEVTVKIEKRLTISAESPFEIILAQGIAKADKMDFIIQKATELGVSRIIPFICARVEQKANSAMLAKKTERWRRIAIEAAKQCGRNVIPQIDEIKSFSEALKHDNKYMKIIPWEELVMEGNKSTDLKDIFRTGNHVGSVVFIGPEGGFEEREVLEAKEAGFLPIMIGPRILKSDTAAISIVSIIQYELGDMGKSNQCSCPPLEGDQGGGIRG